MNWSDLTYSDFYIPYDENQKAIRGCWLTTLEISLEKIQTIFNERFDCFDSLKNKESYKEQKIMLSDIIGTSYRDYGDMSIIKLSRLENGKYFVDGNGNHRVILYKMMMLAEIAKTDSHINLNNYSMNFRRIEKIRKKYWLNAYVCA
ncbi:MAG: hypothetical protein JJE03_02610 [Peptostreptococcaceae bacterium]|nr:hypothetical protein [Peptostreptococcaceae bacterium]